MLNLLFIPCFFSFDDNTAVLDASLPDPYRHGTYLIDWFMNTKSHPGNSLSVIYFRQIDIDKRLCNVHCTSPPIPIIQSKFSLFNSSVNSFI